MTKWKQWLLTVPLIFSGQALAGTLVIPTLERGWVTDLGGHQATVDNYIVGGNKSSQIPLEVRNFFIFDLSALTTDATSATFRVYNPSNGYNSPDSFETLLLSEIDSTSFLDFFKDDPGTSAFTDLGDGVVYGSGDIQDTDLDAFIDIPLNAAALFAINTNPAFGFGGKLTTLDLIDLVVEKVFGNTGTSVRHQNKWAC